jgi:hypothetical protein
MYNQYRMSVDKLLNVLKLTEQELLQKYPNLSLYFNWYDADSKNFRVLKSLKNPASFYKDISNLNVDTYATILKLIDVLDLNNTELDKKLEHVFIGRPKYNSCGN